MMSSEYTTISYSTPVSNRARRFEELSDLAEDEPKAEQPKPSKRPRDDAMDTDEQPAEKVSKKKKAKKQKGEDGKAVSVAVEEKAAEPKGEKEEEKKADKKDKKKQKGPSKELAGGVKIRDVKTGDGKAAKNGAKVSMRYIGKLQNGKVFDQNTKGKPVSRHQFSCLSDMCSLWCSSLSSSEQVMLSKVSGIGS
jgi:FK506-binding nuclear protein